MLNDKEDESKTLDATKPDIIDIEMIDNSNDNVASKEAEEVKEDNISVMTGFAHGKMHKKGVIRSKLLSKVIRQKEKKEPKSSVIQYSKYIQYLKKERKKAYMVMDLFGEMV